MLYFVSLRYNTFHLIDIPFGNHEISVKVRLEVEKVCPIVEMASHFWLTFKSVTRHQDFIQDDLSVKHVDASDLYYHSLKYSYIFILWYICA